MSYSLTIREQRGGKSPVKDCYIKQDCILNAPLQERVFLFANKTDSTNCCSSSHDMQIKELMCICTHTHTHTFHLRYLMFELRIYHTEKCYSYLTYYRFSRDNTNAYIQIHAVLWRAGYIIPLILKVLFPTALNHLNCQGVSLNAHLMKAN